VSFHLPDAASFSFARQMLQTHQRVAHRQEVLKEIQQAVSGVSQLTSSERAYAIIGDPSLLSNREQMKAQIQQHIDDVRTLTKSNPSQQHHLDQLQSLIARYPRAPEAAQAKDRLRKAGATPTASRKPGAAKPRQ